MAETKKTAKPMPNDDVKPYSFHDFIDVQGRDYFMRALEQSERAGLGKMGIIEIFQADYEKYSENWISAEDRKQKEKEQAEREAVEKKKASGDVVESKPSPPAPSFKKKDYLHRLASHISFKTSNRIKDSKSKGKKKKKKLKKKKVYA